MLANSTTNGPHATAPAAKGLSPGTKGGASHAARVSANDSPAAGSAAGTTVAAQKLRANFASLLTQARESLSKTHAAESHKPDQTGARQTAFPVRRGALARDGSPFVHAIDKGEGAPPPKLSSAASAAVKKPKAEIDHAPEKTREGGADRQSEKKEKSAEAKANTVVVSLELSPQAAAPIVPKQGSAGRVAGPERDADIDTVGGKRGSSNKPGPKVTVADFRHSVEGRRADSTKTGGAELAEAVKEQPQDSARKHSSEHADLSREFSLDGGRSGGALDRPRADAAPPTPSASSNFQNLLAEQLRDSWNGEIVKNAHIVLKDGDSGTIRLRLKPESLGNVKIELNLSDNNISGKIVVQSDEAKHAFERNMGNLADAFRQGGFDSAKLEVSVGFGSQQGGGSPSGGETGAPFYSGRLHEPLAPIGAARSASWTAARAGAVDILA